MRTFSERHDGLNLAKHVFYHCYEPNQTINSDCQGSRGSHRSLTSLSILALTPGVEPGAFWELHFWAPPLSYSPFLHYGGTMQSFMTFRFLAPRLKGWQAAGSEKLESPEGSEQRQKDKKSFFTWYAVASHMCMLPFLKFVFPPNIGVKLGEKSIKQVIERKLG